MAFMMRNTSPIGWIPLLAHKVLWSGSLIPFILSGIFVALPILALCTYVDTIYYGGDDWVFTGINFLKVNVVHGLSKYFGEDPWYWYLLAFAPLIYTAIYPLVLYANTISHKELQTKKGQPAYLTYYVCFYVIFFSLIPHKEARFLLPLIPFTLLTTGQLIAANIHSQALLFKRMLTAYIIVESTILAYLTLFHQRAWEVEQYLIDTNRTIHSFYRLDRFDTPYYSWLHPVAG